MFKSMLGVVAGVSTGIECISVFFKFLCVAL